MNRFKDAAKDAANQTDEQLASRISGLTRMTDEQLQEFFPRRPDKEQLLQLLELVHSSTAENKKIERIGENAETLGKAAIALIKLLA